MSGLLWCGVLFSAGFGLLAAMRWMRRRAMRDGRTRDPRDGRPRIAPAALRSLTIELFEALGLGVVEEEVRGPERRLLATRIDEPQVGARCVVFIEPTCDALDAGLVAELAACVERQRASLGVLLTPYAIERGEFVAREVPLELVDGPRFHQLVRAHLPKRLGELERYRGFPSEFGSL